MDRGGDLAFLKNVIFRIPGKNKKGMIRYFREDRKDRLNDLLFQSIQYLLNLSESGKILKRFQSRRAQDHLSY